MHDLIYLEDKSVKVSDSAMQIQEFKDFKRYDRSKDGIFFDKAMIYIFFVYKVFGSDSEQVSYLSNLPLSQRKMVAAKSHTSPYTLSEFEENKYVQKCVEAYLLYARTQNERLLDSLKEDLAKYTSYVEEMPMVITKSVPVRVKVPGEDRFESTTVDVEIPNTKARLDALKDVQTYRDMYNKLEQQTRNDQKIKVQQARLLEDKDVSKMISTEGFPSSNQMS